MKEPIEIYLDLYKEYRSEIRHQESHRSTVSTICVAFAGALVGLSFQDKMPPSLLPYLGLLLINFSLVAILMLRKLYERFVLGRERASLFLAEIDKCVKHWLNTNPKVYPAELSAISTIWNEGKRRPEAEYPFFSFVRLHWLWESLLIGSGLIGIVLLRASEPANNDLLSKLGIHVRMGIWYLAFFGPAAQMTMLFLAQRWEESKTKRVKRWDRALCISFRWIQRQFYKRTMRRIQNTHYLSVKSYSADR